MDEINKRIIDLMIRGGHSKSTFAKELGISLPLITHISTGRNKAGLELIQKILQHFPEVNPDWLLNGMGEMYRETATKVDMSAVQARLSRLKELTINPIKSIETLLEYHKLLLSEVLYLQEASILLTDSRSEIQKWEREIEAIKREIESEVNK